MWVSQTGTAEGFANQMMREARQRGFEATSLDIDNCFAPVRFAQTVHDARSLFKGPERLVSEREADEMMRAFGLSDACPSYRSGFNIACTDGSSDACTDK